MDSPAPPPRPAPPRRGRGWMVVAAVLTTVFAAAGAGLGVVRWARPVWSPSSGWMIEHVPGSLLGLVLGSAVGCVVIAFALTSRGLAVSARGRRERWTAALSTGVVTVPLLALSFALLGSKGPAVTGLVATLVMTAVLGIAPLIGGMAVAGALGGRPQHD